MLNLHQFVRVEFTRFKAFRSFRLDLKHFNILVGPNNAGKSTILAAFRILAAAIRRAGSHRATPVRGPEGLTLGYEVNLDSISVAEENIFYNYEDDEPALVVFHLSNGNRLILHFPERGVCLLVPDAQGRSFTSPTTFKSQFNCPIGFVPILGPVEHHEPLFEKEAARLALFNYRAARNFRNIWYHYPEKFEEFREALKQTWPGMDILRPEVDRSHAKARLHMYCPENRRERELFWAGFGFQVWCQMLTHIIQGRGASIFLIDEPDIYLHAELQRQLLGLLRNLGPDILLATHSTEIVTDAEVDDILLVGKDRRAARRLKNPAEVEDLFDSLGSNINPILTQLAKTRRVLFVEGEDFKILSRFALRIGERGVANRRDFAVVPVKGFNPERIRSLKAGMETTLGGKVLAGAVFDRDYRSADECAAVQVECETFCSFAVVHQRKEIENFLLVPEAMDRALQQRLEDRARRRGATTAFEPLAGQVLSEFSAAKKAYVAGQLASGARTHGRIAEPGRHESELMEATYADVERRWATPEGRSALIPGKDAFGEFNRLAQERYGANVTPTAVIAAMTPEQVPGEMRDLIEMIRKFTTTKPG